MSLQNIGILNQFVVNCTSLWNSWNTGPAAGRQAARETQVRQAINQMTTFMVAPTTVFANTRGWGSFSWGLWRLKLNNKYTRAHDIKYGKFIEYCSTIYHESRHAEQFYRIAQGLALGRLKYPDVSKAQVINQLAGSGSSVREKMALFGGGHGVTSAVTLPTAATLSKWLSIPIATAQHAYASRNAFDLFTALSKPTWFKRNSLLEVEDWMRATYKKTYSEMDSFAQTEEDAPGALRPNVWKMYLNLPEEHDAHSIEGMVDRALTLRIGNADHKNRRRNEAPFAAQYITHEDWMKKTKRTLHTRSKDLVRLDSALLSYEALRTSVNLVNLRTIFNNWYQKNPREASTRNKDGCVLQLKAWLDEQA